MSNKLTADQLEAQARELAERALIQLQAELAANTNTASDDGIEHQVNKIQRLANTINLKLLRTNQTFADLM